MKVSELIGYILSIVTLVGLYFAVPIATIFAYGLIIFGLVVVLFGTWAVGILGNTDLQKAKNAMTIDKFLLGVIVQASWLFVLIATANVSLLYLYILYMILSYVFVLRVLTKQTN